MREFTLRFERWRAMWPEAQALAQQHWSEVAATDPHRPLAMDDDLMQALEDHSSLWILVARDPAGALVGYYTWQVSLDVESKGLVVAQQGAWYVAPGHARVAVAMWDRSILELRALGVKMIFPHHRLSGRGAGLGKFFQRRGAKLIQHTYQLWIGEENA